MENNKEAEASCFADAPWLLAIVLVVEVEELYRDGIGGGDGDWDSGVESSEEDVLGNIKRAHDRKLGG